MRPVGAEVLHADGQTYRQKGERKDGQTDMTKLIVFFHNFANAPEERKHMGSHHMRRYRNLPLSSKLYSVAPPGVNVPKI
jgi:hypothetical protein